LGTCARAGGATKRSRDEDERRKKTEKRDLETRIQ
jgi:hypothetical protein